MVNKLDSLYKRDKTGKKILSYEIQLEKQDLDTTQEMTLFPKEKYLIIRTTGFIDGKKQIHTDIVSEGKQNRTVLQQAGLQAQSMWNSAKDEGYKSLNDFNIMADTLNDPGKSECLTLVQCLDKYLPLDRTDASGVKKPMKCTATNDTKTGKLIPKVLAKIKYKADVQPKLDGVRCFATNYKDGGFRFTSSDGKPYDIVARFIKPELDALNLPVGTILDGELYIHGVPLEKISGLCRKQTAVEVNKGIRTEDLKFWIFDVPSNKTWEERKGVLEDLANPTEPKDSKVQWLMTWTVETFEEIQELHDRWVADGYEGAIIRNLNGKYAYGIRSAEIFKMKNFQDDEFEIIGAETGKRGTFDMIFLCKTKDGKVFGAKPLGDAAVKEQYWNDIEEIKGKKGTVRYLNYSSYGIPVGNPVLKTIRNYE